MAAWVLVELRVEHPVVDIRTGMTPKGGRFPTETAYGTVWWISAGVSLLIAATAAVLTTTTRTQVCRPGSRGR
ncbi:hypothetical protein [Embleya scabrispora]|uniref:hypothetical protein n=1 Tax=Embleya scabrispora TaxID=159449 RepID=UPI00036C4941|nr:hypothetical protein [Embleya scabrispora]MYS86666.1 hypothetical protein [Streptomyces sp. SID5474]